MQIFSSIQTKRNHSLIYLKELSFFVHSQIRPVIFLCSFPLLQYSVSRRSLDRRGEGFDAMDSNSFEAKRWITMAEKLLETGDFEGTQTFANRARESNPIIAEQILSVTETLLTAQSNPRDWYGILQLAPLTQSMEVVASQYRKLALLLNPGRNKLSFADQAFRFVSEAWNVLSNPSKKANYDNELRLLQSGQLGRQQQPQLQQQQQQQPQSQPQTQKLFMQPQAPPPPNETQTLQKETPTQGTQPPIIRKSPRNTDRDGNAPLEGGERSGLNNQPPEQNRSTKPIWRRQMSQFGLAGTSQVNQTGTGSSSQFNRANPTRTPPPRENSEATESNGPTFWTACPYCYVLYEYPRSYEDCTLRCQIKNCRRAFHAGAIPSPPLNGKDSHPSCWGVCPLGFSKGGNFPSWTPVSTMFACSNPNIKNAGEKGPRVYFDDDVDVDFSDSIGSSEDDDDDDWQNERRKKVKNVKGKGSVGSNAKKPQSDREKKATNGEANADHSGNLSGVSTVPEAVPIAESSRKRVATSGRKQMGRGARNLGRLDLNVEFSNEVEETVPRRNEENHPGYGEEDNIEGNAFFEGLDEFLNSLPILSAVGDDKAKAT